MKVLIIEVVPKTKNSIDAHVRNCLKIQEFLKSKGHEVIIGYNNTFSSIKSNDFDVIIVSYSSFYFNYKDAVRLVENNPKARMFFMTNEYDIQPNGAMVKFYKERGCGVIANFPEKTKKFNFATNSYELNLNLLLFSPKSPIQKKYSIIYYGTYRKNRAKYFKKYINSKNIYLSTSTKNFKKFKSIGCDFSPIGKMKWGKSIDTLSLFKYSLYIEDEFTHTHFNNLANRFYEAIACGTVILFDKNCINTIKNSEIKNEDYERFIINSIDDLENRNYEEDLNIQQQWVKKLLLAKENMLNNLESILMGE